MSETNVIAALVAVQAELSHVGKSGEHQQGYSYRRIDDLLEAVHPLFAKHGIVIAPKVRNHINVDHERKGWTTTTLHVRYVVYGPGGVTDKIHVDAVGEAMSNSDKGVNAALSYAYKGAISQLLSLPTHDPSADNEAQLTPSELPAEPRWKQDGWDTLEEHDRSRQKIFELLKQMNEETRTPIITLFQSHGGLMTEDKHLLINLTAEAASYAMATLTDQTEPF